MLINQSELLIKDNSGILKARVLDNKASKLGSLVKMVITKTKPKSKKGKTFKQTFDTHIHGLIIQTKAPYCRYDGSSVRFSSNSACVLNLKNRKFTLGFKRIVSSVPFELLRVNNNNKFKGSSNLMKLAKYLL